MSPASRSKSKDKKAAGKESQKTSLKPPANASTGVGIPTSGYNPLLGTFHTLETAPVSSAPPLHVNGRFRNIDETDDHSGNSIGLGVEYDSVSNNGSWSGESEDQKDKNSNPPSRQEVIPGADSDKREKIRQKNEKKHQRQKERRAQELHERCSGYLMSRKLEALAQQLVAMGFSSERATMALILNEGRVEESVAWLFEGGEEADNPREHNLDGGGNLKIDISEELARIADMEVKFKCSKQEVERAIVACEGDLEQAADSLRLQKQDHPSSILPKPEETGDPPTSGAASNSKLSSSLPISQNSLRGVQSKPTTSSSSAGVTQQRRDERDFNYTKIAVTVGPSAESSSKSTMQLLKKVQPKLEWAKQQLGTDKRWPVAGGPNPNPPVSYSLGSLPSQASPPPSKTEARYVTVGNELKNLQLGSVREPSVVTVMQRPQSKQQMPMPTTSISVSSSTPTSSLSSSPAIADWHHHHHPNGVEPVVMKPNGLVAAHLPTNHSTRSSSSSSYGGGSGTTTHNQLYSQLHYQQQQLQQHYVSSSGGTVDHPGQLGMISNHGNNGLWNRMGGNTSPTLAAATSLGLFSGFGSSGPSSPVDWNTAGGSTQLQLDYTHIDWSLDRPYSSSAGSRLSGMWQKGPLSSSSQSNAIDFYASSGRSIKTAAATMRPVLSNGNNTNGVSIGGLHHEGVVAASESSSASASEWTSPFEEKDLFSLPRQFVSSPSL